MTGRILDPRVRLMLNENARMVIDKAERREKHKLYQREWKKNNKEAALKHQRAYRDRHREKYNAYQKEYQRKRRIALKGSEEQSLKEPCNEFKSSGQGET